MRNKEYRDKLLEGIKDYQKEYKELADKEEPLTRSVQAIKSMNIYKTMLAEYDRLHPETIHIEQAKVTDRRGYKDLPANRHGCVTVFDNLSGCNIQIIDNVLNVEIQ